MATDIERLMVRLEANATSFEKALAKAERNAAKGTGAIEKHFERANKGVKRQIDQIAQSTTALGSSLAGIAGRLAGGAAALVSAGALKGYADDWQGAVNKIAAANNSLSGSQERASQLTDIAIRSFSDLGTVADLYSGLTRSTKDMGASQAQVLSVTETLAKAFAVGGQSAATQAGALTQLNQALATGKLSGDEFNSVAEGSPIIMDLLAKKLGVTRGELKGLASEGKITSKVMIEALLQGAQQIEEQFAKLTPTIEQSLGRLRASVTRYFGQMFAENDLAGKVAQGTQLLLDNLDNVMRAAAVAGVAILAAFTPIGAPLAAAAAALALFGDQIQPIAGNIATLGDYARAAFEIIRGEGGGAFETFRSAVGQAAEALVTIFTGAVDTAATVLSTLSGAVTTVMNTVIGVFVGSVGAIKAAWTGLGPAIAGTIYDAMNAVVKMVNDAVGKIVSALNSVLSAVSLPTIPPPKFDGVDNPYKGAAAELGAGIKNAFSDAMGKEYIADPAKQVEAALGRIKSRANEIGQARADDANEMARRRNARAAEQQRADGSLTQALRNPVGSGGGGGGGKGGGGGANSENEFQKELANIEKRILAFNREKEALGLSAQEAAKAEAAHKLLDAAKQAGIPITDELKGRIDQLSAAYAAAKVNLDNAKKSQEDFKQLQQFVGTSLSGFFSDIVSGGKNASEALMNMTKRLADAAFQAALLGSGPLAGLFGTKGDNGGVGGLLGTLFKGFSGFGGGGGGVTAGGLYSDGGYTGAGGKYAAAGVVHRGEYVMPQEVVKRLGVNNLAALHKGALKGYANGGFVGGSVPSISRGGVGAATINFAPIIDARGADPSQIAVLRGELRQMASGMREIVSGEPKRRMNYDRRMA